MLSFATRFLPISLILVIFAVMPVMAEPSSSAPIEPIRHEVAGLGSGSLEAVLKRHKVPSEVRDLALRGFLLDPQFPKKLPKQSEFRLVYDEFPSALEGERPRLVLRSVWVRAGGKLYDLYRYGWRGVMPVYLNQNGRSLRELVLRLPVDDARLTSKFGWREHPVLKTKKFHYGLDLAAPPGTPVRAAADGTVAMAGRNGNYGLYVRIDHGPGISTGYAHLSSIVTTLKPGTRVRQGEMIGFVGMTGLATGPHLCFQLLEGKKQLNPLTARPMIEEALMEQLASSPSRSLPIGTVGDLQ
ncbi:MAG TPA: M23 family metallopeptidase [Alphaproteobacteria bacterium]|nr:M23 family metallopeptidase [Alphaproteobacteria bacterium]